MSAHASFNIEKILKTIKEQEIAFIDLQFTDLKGVQHHITVPSSQCKPDLFEFGKAFDGSSIPGWKSIHQSDMLLLPDPEAAFMDPFYEDATLCLRCDVIEPTTMSIYHRDPRGIAKRAEAYLKSSGIADEVFFGPEPEFCLFDHVTWQVKPEGASYNLDSEEASWNTNKYFDGANMGHRPTVKGGYFPLPPVDSAQEIRAAITTTLQALGLEVEAHHHEVASNQNEVAVRFNSLLKKADELQLFKYVVRNIAHSVGKTATFMPKPIVGDNGSGMHCHQSLQKNGKNLFSGDGYAGLSETALYYIGGIIHHARALNAFTNPATNSYKRLVPGFEAPVLLAYSSCNRSAAIRIPMTAPKQDYARRIEVRFPDPLANPYLAFSAMVLAGLDGIRNRIHPGDPMDVDLYELPPEKLKNIPSVCAHLGQALEHLESDYEFLMVGDVFNKSVLESYLSLKRAEIQRLEMTTHPVEFDLYYSG